MGSSPSQRKSCVSSCLNAVGSTGAGTKAAKMSPPHHASPCSAAVVHGACGLSCRMAVGKKAKTRHYQRKQDFPQKAGAGSLCPLGNCSSSSWACSHQHGPCTVLASASGEPIWAGPAASGPSLLPNLPPAVFAFRAHHAQRLMCARSHLTQKLAPGCLGRSQVNLHPPHSPGWEG